MNDIGESIKSYGNKERKVELIIEAWKVLKDPESRKVYDNELKGNTLNFNFFFVRLIIINWTNEIVI